MNRYTVDQIVAAVEHATCLTFSEIVGRERCKPVMRARQLMAYTLYTLCIRPLSYPDVAAYMCRKRTNHATQILRCKSAKKMLENPSEAGEQFRQLLAEVIQHADAASCTKAGV